MARYRQLTRKRRKKKKEKEVEMTSFDAGNSNAVRLALRMEWRLSVLV
jgi:hypothetical protein